MKDINDSDIENGSNHIEFEGGEVQRASRRTGGLDDPETQAELDAHFNLFDTASAGWEHKRIKVLLAEETYQFILDLREWKHFLTLTFRDEVPNDIAIGRLSYLIRMLNTRLFGKGFRRIVGKSYFSIVYGTEYQKRDVLHFHAVIDKPIDYSFIHSFWNELSGFAWIEPIINNEDCLAYITKYITKGGEVEISLSESTKEPLCKPGWW